MNRACLPALLFLCQCVNNSPGSNGGSTAAGSTGTATAAGTVDGISLTPQSALFGVSVNKGSDGSGDTARALIMISSDSDACAPLEAADEVRVPSTILWMEVLTIASTSIQTGTVSINSSSTGSTADNYGDAQFANITADGNSNVEVKSGTIAIGAANATTLSGSYSLLFDNGSLSGHFSATPCSPLANE